MGRSGKFLSLVTLKGFILCLGDFLWFMFLVESLMTSQFKMVNVNWVCISFIVSCNFYAMLQKLILCLSCFFYITAYITCSDRHSSSEVQCMEAACLWRGYVAFISFSFFCLICPKGVIWHILYSIASLMCHYCI